jgi:uncharacterized membrane protein YoaK (UPF0700 family)
MKLLLEYFGLIVLAFVVLVGGLILLPRVTTMPQTSPSEMVGLALAFVVIGGGFSWYYLASSHQGTAGPPPRR